MAQLRNIDMIWTAKPGKLVTVGNNRQIARTEENGHSVFDCYLHASRIAQVTPHGSAGTATVRLDDCGYLTTTTIAAMTDFMRAFGVRGSASRAGGILSARWTLEGVAHDRESATGDSMSFAADRY